MAASSHRDVALAALIGGAINVKHIRAHWGEILRLATSIRQGTVTASLMFRKLGSYPRQSNRKSNRGIRGEALLFEEICELLA